MKPRWRGLGALWILAWGLTACREPPAITQTTPRSTETEASVVTPTRAERRERPRDRAARAAPSGQSAPALAASPWLSRENCQKVVARRETLGRVAGRARVGAWNVRWFPDGAPGKRRGARPTDTLWLGCALAYLDVDVLALEEVKGHRRGLAALDEVLREAGRLSGAEFRARLDDCAPEVTQHVALIWNAKRVKAERFRTFGELNPLAGPCQNQLRPGLGGRFRFPGGLDLEIVAVHLKSGTAARDAALRERSFQRLPEVLARVEAEHRDADLLVAGDFNVMGCQRCAPAQDGASELALLRQNLAARQPPWRVLAPEPGCSHYYSRKPALLDLMAVPRSMRELGSEPVLVASGLCGDLACGPLPRETPAAYRELSDHCPIVLDLIDQDLD